MIYLSHSHSQLANDIRRVGYIHFPHLLQVTLLRENVECTQVAGSNSLTSLASGSSTANAGGTSSAPKEKGDNAGPIIMAKSKIFEINNINEVAKVSNESKRALPSTKPNLHRLPLP